jgi:NADPH:quinone reductase-like Zn-dependent oxidoreductase
MKSWIIPDATGLDSWKLIERDVPRPGPGQALVRLHAASLNYRDVLIAKGVYDGKPVRNRVPVSDGAGEVIEIGAGVTRVRPGDRVAGIFCQTWLGGEAPADAHLHALCGGLDGVLAEYRVFNEQGLVRIPAHLGYREGATLPCAAVTAWNALYAIRPLLPGQTVLALGTGGVSIFAAQFANVAGARVIVTSSSDEKLEVARRLGASETINYAQHPDWDKEVMRLTEGRGVDHVIEVGGKGTIERSVASVRPGGVISLIGVLARAPSGFNPLAMIGTGKLLHGVLVGSREMFEAMNRAISFHAIRPAIHQVFPFDRAPEALAAMVKGEHVGKIVIDIAPD